MTVKVVPLHVCAKKNCGKPATHRVTFETKRGTMNGPAVCSKHIIWGRVEAKRMEDS